MGSARPLVELDVDPGSTWKRLRCTSPAALAAVMTAFMIGPATGAVGAVRPAEGPDGQTATWGWFAGAKPIIEVIGQSGLRVGLGRSGLTAAQRYDGTPHRPPCHRLGHALDQGGHLPRRLLSGDGRLSLRRRRR